MLMLERQAEFLSPFKLLCTIRARMLGCTISATHESYILIDMNDKKMRKYHKS